MKSNFVIDAEVRKDNGRSASRRLRHLGLVPGIVYGASIQPKNIVVNHNMLQQLLVNEKFYTNILELKIEGASERVILRDLQRHPYKPVILHLDLQRVSETEKLTVRIPLHFMGAENAPGVKLSQGLIAHLISDVEVRCLPKDLPEEIEVDLSTLEINQTIHLSDLKLADGIEILALTHGEDHAVATAYVPKTVVEDTAAPVTAEVPSAKGGAKEEAAEGGASSKAAADKKEKSK